LLPVLVLFRELVCEVVKKEHGEGDGCDEGNESVSRPYGDCLCHLPSFIRETVAISTRPRPKANVLWHTTVTHLEQGVPNDDEINLESVPLQHEVPAQGPMMGGWVPFQRNVVCIVETRKERAVEWSPVCWY
jgi:hypothetical protein